MNALTSDFDRVAQRTGNVTIDVESAIGAAIADLRSSKRLYRTEVAAALGIKESGLRRHELGLTKVTVSRLIQICEAMEANPIDVIVPVAPLLFGRTETTAAQISTIVKILSSLDAPAVSSVFNVVQHFSRTA